MNTVDYRPAILAYLDAAKPSLSVAALRALVVEHGPASGLGRENTCAGCAIPDVSFQWLERCPVVLLVARELDLIPANSAPEGDHHV